MLTLAAAAAKHPVLREYSTTPLRRVEFDGRKLLDPMATVFNTEKRANWTMGNGVTLAGRFMPMERLAAYDANFYSDVLGPDIVREASDAAGTLDPSKLATILETLPVDMQRALSAQMR